MKVSPLCPAMNNAVIAVFDVGAARPGIFVLENAVDKEPQNGALSGKMDAVPLAVVQARGLAGYTGVVRSVHILIDHGRDLSGR